MLGQPKIFHPREGRSYTDHIKNITADVFEILEQHHQALLAKVTELCDMGFTLPADADADADAEGDVPS